jgi:probable FeS assembly SUF system protein SufT|tara:strand:+ start:4585 stop:5130 length:546 start_codon:yes stop_codon:yes gene_type:complete
LEIDHNKIITISRNCDATMIPAGEKIVLIEGTHVRITQSLGGNFTVLVNGNLVKVLGQDADALGLEEIIKKELKVPTRLANEADIWDAMKQCFDPEIPVNIVDLGLIYDLKISGKKSEQNIHIKMTLTAPGCGMGPSIAQDVENKITSLNGINNVDVELVWDPQWERDMMSEDAKLQLGML